MPDCGNHRSARQAKTGRKGEEERENKEDGKQASTNAAGWQTRPVCWSRLVSASLAGLRQVCFHMV